MEKEFLGEGYLHPQSKNPRAYALNIDISFTTLWEVQDWLMI